MTNLIRIRPFEYETMDVGLWGEWLRELAADIFAWDVYRLITQGSSRQNMIRMDNPVSPVEIMIEKTLYGYGSWRRENEPISQGLSR